jgi:hypothetical protein
MLSTESSMSFVVRFLNTPTSTSPPAFTKAFSKSYSQFVPGNTGIYILGLTIFIFGPLQTFLPENFKLTSSLISSSLVGKTDSNGLFHFS